MNGQPKIDNNPNANWTTNHEKSMQTENQTSKPEESPRQEAGDGCSGATCSAWIDAATKPTGCERKVLVWVVWPQCGWPQWPEPKIAWWKHSPGCFSVDDVENANHLVTHWMDIHEPNSTNHRAKAE